MSFAPYSNLAYVELLYSQYRQDPKSVSPEWQRYFAENLDEKKNGHSQLSPTFTPRSIFNPATPAGGNGEFLPGPRAGNLQERVYEMVRNYRVRGHMIAQVDPLGAPRPSVPELELEYYGFNDSELNLLVNSASLPYGTPLTVREIYERMRNTYSRSIGAQFMHIGDNLIRQWLQRRMEASQNHLALSHDEQVRILTRLTDAVIFEEFLRKKFLGAKTFSLDGSETLLPLLDLAIEQAIS